MGSYINPNAFTNAFNLQRQMGAQSRAADQDEEIRGAQITRAKAINALGPNATPEDYIRAGDANTGNALAGVNRDREAAMTDAFPRVGQIAAQISTIPDPTQRRAAFRNALTSNAQLFEQLGMPTADALAKLDGHDDTALDATLAALAQHAPQAGPVKLAAGDSLVTRGPDGGYSAAFTAPAKPGEEKNLFGNIDPSNYTPASVAKFQQSKNYGDLVAVPKQGNLQAQSQVAATLRDDFRNDSKVFQGVSDAMQRVVDSASDPTGAGDVALLYNYLKVLDPASTVREGEFQTVGSSGGLPTQIQGYFSKMVDGKLPTGLRDDVVNRATKLYKGQEARYTTQVLERYKGLAKRYGVNPDEFSDPRLVAPAAAAPPPPASGERTATGPDGKRIVLRGGRWVPL